MQTKTLFLLAVAGLVSAQDQVSLPVEKPNTPVLGGKKRNVIGSLPTESTGKMFFTNSYSPTIGPTDTASGAESRPFTIQTQIPTGLTSDVPSVSGTEGPSVSAPETSGGAAAPTGGSSVEAPTEAPSESAPAGTSGAAATTGSAGASGTQSGSGAAASKTGAGTKNGVAAMGVIMAAGLVAIAMF